jgi:hypothetical protein
MKTRRAFMRGFIAVLLTLMFVNTVFAGSVGNNGVTLTWPEYPLTGSGLLSCEPWENETANSVDLTGIPEGASVIVTFAYSNPYQGSPMYMPPITYPEVSGGSLTVPVAYPESENWPLFNEATNERAIAVAAMVQVRVAGKTYAKLNSKQWWVRCLPPPPPAQGCTPGYWRQDHHFDSWEGYYSPNQSYTAVFGVSPSFGDITLEEAVWLGGGGQNALARHAVAAILNAANPNVNYAYTVAEVIAGVQAAYASPVDFETFKDALDLANNAGCPLD